MLWQKIICWMGAHMHYRRTRPHSLFTFFANCILCGEQDFEYGGNWNGSGILECKCGCAVYIVQHEEDKVKESDDNE